MSIKKKGQMQNTVGYVIMLIAIMVGLFVFFILGDALQGATVANSTSYNATSNIIQGGANLTEQMPTVGTIIGVMIIVGVVAAAGFFGYQYFNKR